MFKQPSLTCEGESWVINRLDMKSLRTIKPDKQGNNIIRENVGVWGTN